MLTPVQQLLDYLRRSLHPQHTRQATLQLHTIRTTPGFTSSLVLISDNQSLELPVKVSAIVYLKNLIEQQFKNPTYRLIPNQDLQLLKLSVFSLLLKFIHKNQTQLLPTIKYICFLFVKYLYKENQWDSLIPELLKHLELCHSFSTVKAALIMVKILFQVMGKCVMEEIKLNNLATKIVLPMIGLASKMYADLSMFSCVSLEEVFKILTEAIEFHLPEVIHKNIHVFMVLVKNVLDLKPESVNLEKNQHESTVRTLRLKRQALVFLRKLYERHSTTNIKQLQTFVLEFNQKYSRAYFETIVGIIMTKPEQTVGSKSEQHQILLGLNFSLVTHALGIFSFIANNKEAVKYIEADLRKYQLKILYLSIERFLNCHSRKLESKIKASSSTKEDLFENYTDFLQTFREERLSLRLFLTSIFSNKKTQNQQQNIEQILQLLLKCVTDGSLKQKQLGLYLLSNLEGQIELLSAQTSQNLQEKWVILLKQFVFPLLSMNSEGLSSEDTFFAKLIKLRGFEMYRRFEFLEIEQEHLVQVCEKIFETLVAPGSLQIDLFVKIQAVETFNQILASENWLIPKLQCKIPQLLRIYTQLLSRDFQMMRFYEQLLSLLNSYISPIVHQLLDLLCQTYFKLSKQKSAKFNCLSTPGKHSRDHDQEEEETVFHEEEILEESDNETIYEDLKHNYDSVGSQCLASIKKLVFKYPLDTAAYADNEALKQKLLVVVLSALASSDQIFIKEALAILNLLLYKNYISQTYHYLLPALLYPVTISSNTAFADQLAAYVKSSPYFESITGKQHKLDFASAYIQLLNTISQDTFSRTFAIFDEIGCVKNYIKLLGHRLYTFTCPITAKSYLQMLVETVILVQEANDQQGYSKSEVLSVLSIYQALLEQQVFPTSAQKQNPTPDIYFQTLIKNIAKWTLLIDNSPFEKDMKDRFRSFYLRIVMMAACMYPLQFVKIFELQVAGKYISMTDFAYPLDKVCVQVNDFIVQRITGSMQPLSQLKGESGHILNDTFIMFKGVTSLLQSLLSYVISLGQGNTSTVQNILRTVNQRANCFFSRMYFIMMKLSLQVLILTAKQSHPEMLTPECWKIPLDMIQSIDQLIAQGVSKNNEGSDDTNFLAAMFDQLNIIADTSSASQFNEENTQENRIHQLKQSKYEVKYQHDLKHVGEMQEDGCSSDQSDFGSSNSDDQENPFECEDEEYLYAYDSVVFGGIFTGDKKQWTKKLFLLVLQIYSSEPIELVKRTFPPKF